ncbi:MAG: P1 family peptidase [Pseudomonadota bacterium]
MRNLLTDVTGVRVAHAENGGLMSGVTAILIDRPNTAVGCVTGGAPGTRGLSILAADSTNDGVDAIVLSGGSAFGLDAAGGVMASLREAEVGFEIGGIRVPIVAQAITFDLLAGGESDWPGDDPVYWRLGRVAADSAQRLSSGHEFSLGSVGGGIGATTADAKGGVGSASARTSAGHTVAAIAVVNAIGTALIDGGPHFWAGAYECEDEFGGLGWPQHISREALNVQTKGGLVTATTIACVATDAPLRKPELARVLAMANDGYARALRPVHAPLDGDTMFAVSVPDTRAPDRAITTPSDITAIGTAAADCVARAIARGVYLAGQPAGNYRGPPSYRDRFA